MKQSCFCKVVWYSWQRSQILKTFMKGYLAGLNLLWFLILCTLPAVGPTDPREQRVNQREETWNTVPMTKSSRTIDPAKIPKISKVRLRAEVRCSSLT